MSESACYMLNPSGGVYRHTAQGGFEIFELDKRRWRKLTGSEIEFVWGWLDEVPLESLPVEVREKEKRR